MTEYKERFVAYIDILGFSELVRGTVGPERAISLDELIAALEVPRPGETGQIIIGRIGDLAESGHRMSAFGEAVAITVHPTPVGLLHLLHHVERIGFRLLRLKTPVFCRGSITRGQVYHDGQLIFGPALEEACSLASRQAKYPRVILSEEAYRVGLEAEPPLNHIIKRFVHLDEADGRYFVNILRILRMAMDYEEEPSAEIRALSEHIGQHLQEEGARLTGKELEKLKWFQGYFDWATDRSGWLSLKQPSPGPLE